VAIGVGDYVTAAELAAGKLVHTHDSSENFTDSFRLVPIDDQGITAGTATATNHTSTGTELIVPITLTPINDAHQYQHKSQLISGEAGAITEGATATIGGALAYANTNGITGAGTPTLPANNVAHLVYGDTDNSTEQRQYRITTAPANGSLLLSGAVLPSARYSPRPTWTAGASPTGITAARPRPTSSTTWSATATSSPMTAARCPRAARPPRPATTSS
jgi:hypothetical protein